MHVRLGIVAISLGCMAYSMAAPMARADAVDCQRAIQLAQAKYLRARAPIVRKCQDSSVRTGIPASPTDCPTSADDAKLDALEMKLRGRIAAACGGVDKTCDGVGDESLASIGWNIAACPDLGTEGCTNAIATCDDVATCLACIANQAIAKGSGIAYDQLDAGAFATGSDLNKCQRALGKETVTYFHLRAKLLGTCWGKLIKGTAGFSEPPGCPATDAKLLEKLARAEKKKIAKICAACGAGGDADGDGQCDAPGTAFTAAQIGFEADCPDEVVPGSGRACDHPGVTSLADVIDCVDCMADFTATCGNEAAIPALKVYPAECHAAP